MIVTLGANVRTITAAMVLATILVNLLTAITIGASTVAQEIATMKTGVVAMKSAATTQGTMKSVATTQGTTMIAMLTDEMGAALMRHSVLAVAVVVVEESLVRTLWLNFPPPRFGCRN
jgi:hypothetical protein